MSRLHWRMLLICIKLVEDNEAYHVVQDLEGLGDVQQFEVCALKAKLTALSDQRDYTRAYAILDACVNR